MSKTHERILLAARKRFSVLGFYITSVDEIAAYAKKS
jgi:AcrR family transcriptional regulator